MNCGRVVSSLYTLDCFLIHKIRFVLYSIVWFNVCLDNRDVLNNVVSDEESASFIGTSSTSEVKSSTRAVFWCSVSQPAAALGQKLTASTFPFPSKLKTPTGILMRIEMRMSWTINLYVSRWITYFEVSTTSETEYKWSSSSYYSLIQLTVMTRWSCV